MSATLEPIELTFELRLMPQGRYSFRRWRWELWHRERLLAIGWRGNPLHSQRALRGHAIRYAHRLHGVHPLRPDATTVPERRWGEHPVLVESGQLRVVLTPRALVAAGVRMEPIAG